MSGCDGEGEDEGDQKAKEPPVRQWLVINHDGVRHKLYFIRPGATTWVNLKGKVFNMVGGVDKVKVALREKTRKISHIVSRLVIPTAEELSSPMTGRFVSATSLLKHPAVASCPEIVEALGKASDVTARNRRAWMTKTVQRGRVTPADRHTKNGPQVERAGRDAGNTTHEPVAPPSLMDQVRERLAHRKTEGMVPVAQLISAAAEATEFKKRYQALAANVLEAALMEKDERLVALDLIAENLTEEKNL